MTSATSLDATALEELQTSFSGLLVTTSDATYDPVRAVHNGMIDRKPALIAQCLGPADVVDAVKFARAQGLEISVRGGGHNVAGTAVTEGGVMIDCSLMQGVDVDPVKRVARVQPGATWSRYNRETQLHGLGSTGGVISTTGVAGLTLGGGLGWLMGNHGLAIDNLISVDLVTAEGEVLRASATENEDLFWALRGGGGNFGVATSLEFQLHPLGPMITGGLIAYPFEHARDVLRFYREFTETVADEMTLFSGLVHAPDGSGTKLAAIIACHSGSLDEGEKATQPIKAFGTPVMDMLGPIPYSAQNAILDDDFPRGSLNYWKSGFVDELTDAAIDTLIESFAKTPSIMSGMVLEHFHGEATRIGETDTACPHRQVGHNLVIPGVWNEPADNDANVAWCRESYAAVEPHLRDRRYVNYIAEGEGDDAVRAAYGPNYPRLQQVKAKYDPGNVFHMNQNIVPA